MPIIKKTVQELIDVYSTRNPFDICKNLGIDVIKGDLSEDMKGFFQRTSDGSIFIHIDSKLSEEDGNYICAHELGHALLHENLEQSYFGSGNLQTKDKYDTEADRFATELLVEENLKK